MVPVGIIVALSMPGAWHAVAQLQSPSETDRAVMSVERADQSGRPATDPRRDRASYANVESTDLWTPPEDIGDVSVGYVTHPARDEAGPGREAPVTTFSCRMPTVPVETTRGCDRGATYPSCKWRMPQPHRARRLYRVWRNTDEESRWGRPALVSLVLAAAAEYARHYPGEILAVGDLDAPGPRHNTHDDGVDVDLYLPGMMAVENEGGGEYTENYAELSSLQLRMVRGRVETLAKILAACSGGRIRIYYNDEPVLERFERWYGSQGYESPFGRAMQRHNDLHRFHFHVTIPRDLPVLTNEGVGTSES